MAETQLTGRQIKDGGLTDADVASANKDGGASTPSLRTLGTGAAQACAGNDSRLSDARAPTAFNTLSAVDLALADTVPIYDASGSANKSVTVDRFGGFLDQHTFQARLTGQSGVAVPTSDVMGSGNLYLTPYRGDKVVVFDGTRHLMYTLSQVTLDVTSLTPGTYDIFLYSNGGTLTLEATAWNVSTAAITGATNASPIVLTSNGHGLTTGQVVAVIGVGGNTAANGTRRVGTTTANTFQLLTLGAINVAGNGNYTSGGNWYRVDETTTRATALTTQDGVLYKNGALTRRYVGTIFINWNPGSVYDATIARWIWNYNNRVRRDMSLSITNSHTYTTAAWRAFVDDLQMQVEFVIGVQEDAVDVGVGGDLSGGTGHLTYAPDGVVGSNPSLRHSGSVTNRFATSCFLPKGAGYHNFRLAQFGAASTAYNFALLFGAVWG